MPVSRVFVAIAAVLMVALSAALSAVLLATPARAEPSRLIGLVEDGRFLPLAEDGEGVDGAALGFRLTRIARQEARSVESGEIDLGDYEGAAILVQGVAEGGWIYEAEILDRASPIVTELIRQRHQR